MSAPLVLQKNRRYGLLYAGLGLALGGAALAALVTQGQAIAGLMALLMFAMAAFGLTLLKRVQIDGRGVEVQALPFSKPRRLAYADITRVEVHRHVSDPDAPASRELFLFHAGGKLTLNLFNEPEARALAARLLEGLGPEVEGRDRLTALRDGRWA